MLMNPFSGPLSRIGLLIWSIVYAAITLILPKVVSLSLDEKNLIPFAIFVAYEISFSILLLVRRLQNAGLNSYLSLIVILPIIGQIFWIIMLFVPPKRQTI